MVCLTAIAAHDTPRLQRMGLRRALLTRRANLGDCPDAASVLRQVLRPGALDHPACVVPLPRRRRGQVATAELAVQVARRSLQGAAGLDPQHVGALIYCHATPDERTTDSTAGHLQFTLGLPRALPFSVSQAHNTALLIALDLAAGLIEGPESAPSVLVVAADKLLFGPPPHPARQMVWGDVAAAAMLCAHARSGWRIEQVLLRHWSTAVDAVDCGAALLHQCLADAGLTPDRLAAVITPAPGTAFVRRLHAAAGLPAPHTAASGARASHASCADLLVHLAALEAATPAGRPVLAWCHGHNGEFACAVMTRLG
jgi:hypothetical protein